MHRRFFRGGPRRQSAHRSLRKPSVHSRNSAGINLRAVRSPEAPKMAITASSGFGLCWVSDVSWLRSVNRLTSTSGVIVGLPEDVGSHHRLNARSLPAETPAGGCEYWWRAVRRGGSARRFSLFRSVHVFRTLDSPTLPRSSSSNRCGDSSLSDFTTSSARAAVRPCAPCWLARQRAYRRDVRPPPRLAHPPPRRSARAAPACGRRRLEKPAGRACRVSHHCR